MVDVSRNVVAVLLVLVVLVSGFGTYSLLSHSSNTPSVQPSSNGAQIGLVVEQPRERGAVTLEVGEANG